MKAIFIICGTILAASAVSSERLLCMCPPEPNVCGSDFRNYAGECNLNCAASREGRQIYMIYNGPCEDLYRPDPSPNPYSTCDPCGMFSRYQPYNPYNPYWGSGKIGDN